MYIMYMVSSRLLAFKFFQVPFLLAKGSKQRSNPQVPSSPVGVSDLPFSGGVRSRTYSHVESPRTQFCHVFWGLRPEQVCGTWADVGQNVGVRDGSALASPLAHSGIRTADLRGRGTFGRSQLSQTGVRYGTYSHVEKEHVFLTGTQA